MTFQANTKHPWLGSLALCTNETLWCKISTRSSRRNSMIQARGAQIHTHMLVYERMGATEVGRWKVLVWSVVKRKWCDGDDHKLWPDIEEMTAIREREEYLRSPIETENQSNGCLISLVCFGTEPPKKNITTKALTYRWDGEAQGWVFCLIRVWGSSRMIIFFSFLCLIRVRGSGEIHSLVLSRVASTISN